MAKKSGQAGNAVPPVGPKKPADADVADPGKVAETKAEQSEPKSGKYGSQKVKAFKPPADAGTESVGSGKDGAAGKQDEKEDEEKKTWIEIELVGEDDKPIPGERYRITLPDGSVAEGTLDENGFARVEGFEKGKCKVTFPDLDKNAWESAG